MQNRKRDTDVQNRLLDFVGEGEGGMFQQNRKSLNLDIKINSDTILVKKINTLFADEQAGIQSY